MKSWLLVICLVLTSVSLKAQDWIVLKTTDTIFCRIVNVTETTISYKTISSEPESSIPRDLIEMYHRNEFSSDPVILPIPDDIPPPPPIPSRRKRNRDKGPEFGLFAGYTYRLAGATEGSSDAVKEHIRKLKSGFNIKTEVMYFFGRFFGLGAKYTFSHSSASTDNISGYTPFGYPYFGQAEDNIDIHFIGIHPTSRISSKDKLVRFLPGITFGFLATENRSYVGRYFTLKGATFGFSIDLSLEFNLIDGLYFGVNAELALGTITKANYDDGIYQGKVTYNNGGGDNLSRLDASGGIRYYFQ